MTNTGIAQTGPATTLAGLVLEGETGGDVEKKALSRDTLRGMGVALLPLLAVLAAVLLLQQPAHAGESFEWTGKGNDGNWVNSCNWHPEGNCKQTYPGKSASDDQAIIKRTASAPAHVALGEDITVSSLSLEGEGVSLTGGHIAVSNNLNWTGGSLDIDVSTGSLSFSNIDGPAEKVLLGDLTNNGVISQGNVPVTIGAGSDIVNYGRYSAMEGARFNGMTCCVDPPRIVNQGRFVVSDPLLPLPGSNTVTVDNVSFAALGTIDTGDGVLELGGAPGQISADTKFVGVGRVRVTDLARITMLGPFYVSPETEFELSSSAGDSGQGTLLGTGVMDGGGLFLWTGGDIAGNLKLQDGIEAYVTGPARKDLTGTLSNRGRFALVATGSTQPPAGTLWFGPQAKFNNDNIFIADERTAMTGVICCTLPAAFNNTGRFTVRPAGTTPGTVTVKNLLFKAGGSIRIDRGALEFRKGPGVLGPIDITGKGTLRTTDGASMTLTGAFNVERGGTFELASCGGGCAYGQLAGEGTLGGGGRFLWTGGTIGESGNLTVADDSSMAISGTAPKELKGNVTNKGKTTFTSPAAPKEAGPVWFVGPSKFTNEGTFYAGDRTAFRATICCADPARFVNEGRFVLSKALVPSTGSVEVNNMAFENRGTAELAGGRLILGRAGAYDQFSGSTRLVGGGIESGGVPLKLMGGSLAGKGTVAANVENLNGTVAPGTPGTAGSVGVIRITGNYTHSGRDAILKLDLKGATAGTKFDQLQAGGEAYVGWGVMDLDTARGYAPSNTTRLKVLTAGKVSGGGFSRLQDAGLPNQRKWYAIYNPTNITLGVRRA